ncbi:DUF3472 domain-containing protein [Rubritalea tangerina]|uniref:DUF3472 domain-containing protein n=2 Tax=Rubritalea tangerina TaxID=430798 RepID=A0ABW4Z7C6_9BACT
MKMKTSVLGVMILGVAQVVWAEGIIERKSADGSRFYQGEKAEQGVLRLDANNGFFDKGSFRALGKEVVENPDEKALIKSHSASLQSLKAGNAGAARWYFLMEKAGAVQIMLQFQNPRDLGKLQEWEVGVGGRQQAFKVNPLEGQQHVQVEIPLSEGVQTLSLSLLSGDVDGVLESVVLKGESVQSAQLLRARWRPAAVHARYSSKSCPKTRMWVFETRNDLPSSNYSPITTSFGYFGASFDADQRASGGLNFSMWAASQHAEKVPSLERMPHLIASGNPEAQFSGFGHEGSGVKIRGWEPFSHRPKSVIQALRVETSEGMDTFYGYIYDEPSESWKLFASAMRPQKHVKDEGGSYLRVGSFCEVPGPPQRERTGDQRRQVARRGWFYGADGKWHAIDTIHLGSKGEISSKAVGVAKDGWLTMATGGIEMTRPAVSATRAEAMALPDYLKGEKERQLWKLPVGFKGGEVLSVRPQAASVMYSLEGLEAGAQAKLYYGTVDCLSFVARALHGTEKKGVSKDFLGEGRVWQESTQFQSVINGANRFEIKGLKPATQYYFRLYVKHGGGQSWAYKSGQFTTPAE